MTKADMVTEIRAEAKNNPAFKAIAQLFAARQRTRFIVTLSNLNVIMEKQGYTFGIEEYEKILKFLSTLGVGDLIFNRKGTKIVALNNIKIRLQSLGKVALSESDEIEKQTKPRGYVDIVKETEKVHAADFIESGKKQASKSKEIPALKTKVRESSYPAFLTLLIDGKIVNFPGPSGLRPEELGEFLVKFKKLSKDQEL